MNANELLKRFHKEEARLDMLREQLRESYGIQNASAASIGAKIKELRDERARMQAEIERRYASLRASLPSVLDGQGED